MVRVEPGWRIYLSSEARLCESIVFRVVLVICGNIMQRDLECALRVTVVNIASHPYGPIYGAGSDLLQKAAAIPPPDCVSHNVGGEKPVGTLCWKHWIIHYTVKATSTSEAV